MYYCERHFKYLNPITLVELNLNQFEYRTEGELNKLEVIL